MKRTISILLALIFASVIHAQPFQKGTSALNLGVGFGSTLGGLGTGRPAISLSYEKGMWDAGKGIISLGAYAGNTGYSYKDAGYSQKWNYNVVGLRSAYHYNGFNNVPKLDPYAGLMLGYNFVTYSVSGDYQGANNYGSGLGYAFFVGGRWFFTDKIAAFAELGYGVSALNAGVALKF